MAAAACPREPRRARRLAKTVRVPARPVPLADVSIDKLDKHDWLRPLIIAAQRSGRLSPDLAQTAHDIRMAGNAAVHRGAVGARKALDVLDDTGKVLSALYGG